MGGSALKAKMNRNSLPGFKAMSPGRARFPKTNSAPLSEKLMKLTTKTFAASKPSFTIGTLSTRMARGARGATPQPMVRQFPARKLEENVATSPKKQKRPATACPRGPMTSRANQAAVARRTTAAASPARQVHGVGGTEADPSLGAAAESGPVIKGLKR